MSKNFNGFQMGTVVWLSDSSNPAGGIRCIVTGVHKTMLAVLDPATQNVYQVYQNQNKVAQACDEVFPLGKRVTSKFGGFTGVVTGYEFNTNRIVCKGVRASNGDRTRYSYAIHELEEQVFRFAVNSGDVITLHAEDKSFSVYASYDPATEKTMLINCDTNQVMYKIAGKLITEEFFHTYGLLSLELAGKARRAR